MRDQSIERQFFKFVLPSMFTVLLSSFYGIVDGLFVGRALGDAGLAAINLAWPITALIFAVATGVGTGGAVLMSMRRGEGNEEAARVAEGNTVVLLGFGAVLCTALFLLFLRPVLGWLGAEGELLGLAEDYSRVIVSGCTLQIFGTGLTPPLRNNNKTVQAMLIMICGLVGNIAMDALFLMVFGWGIAGAAWATVLSQGITAVLCTVLLLRRNEARLRLGDLRLRGATVRRILRIGISPFGISLSPNFALMLNNWQCLRYGGETAVAAYAVASYVIGSVQQLLSGVGEGVQPLISFCSGAKTYGSMRALLRRSAVMSTALGVVFFAVTLLTRGALPALFGASAGATELLQNALLCAGLAFPFYGMVRLSSSYFYASGEARFSLMLVYGDPVVLTPLLLFLLPMRWGVDGIWAVLPTVQAALALLLLPMYCAHRRTLLKKGEELHG